MSNVEKCSLVYTRKVDLRGKTLCKFRVIHARLRRSPLALMMKPSQLKIFSSVWAEESIDYLMVKVMPKEKALGVAVYEYGNGLCKVPDIDARFNMCSRDASLNVKLVEFVSSACEAIGMEVELSLADGVIMRRL